MNPSTLSNDTKLNPPGNILNSEIEDSRVLDQARLTVYRFLSLVATDPQSERWPQVLDLDFQELVEAAIEVLQDDSLACPDVLAPGEVSPETLGLAPLTSYMQMPRDTLIKEYDHIFGLLVSGECPPYETEYCPQTFSVYRSHSMADIAGFYRAFGLEPSRKSPERHDHIVLELEFMAWLIAKTLYALEEGEEDNANLCREAQVNFFRDHFAWWTPAFALALRRKADGIADEREIDSPPKSYQGAFGAFLTAFVPAERGILGIAPPTALIAPARAKEEDCDTCPLSANQNSE